MNEVDQIKQEIAHRTASLGDKVETLQTHVRNLADPATQIQEHPIAAMAICFGAGLLLGKNSRQARKVLEPVTSTLATLMVRELTHTLADKALHPKDS